MVRVKRPRLPTSTLQLLTDPKSFSAVIDKGLFEPGMLQGLFGRDAVLGIVNKDPLQQVQEQPVEVGVGWDEFCKLFHGPHVPP